MNEIALANFYRVLNDADRFPTEKELAEAAIAAKEELNALRAPAQPAPIDAAPTDSDPHELVVFSLLAFLRTINEDDYIDTEHLRANAVEFARCLAAIMRKHTERAGK